MLAKVKRTSLLSGLVNGGFKKFYIRDSGPSCPFEFKWSCKRESTMAREIRVQMQKKLNDKEIQIALQLLHAVNKLARLCHHF